MHVFKYHIALNDRPTRIPITAADKIVHVAEQSGMLTMWVEIHPTNYSYQAQIDPRAASSIYRDFMVFETGRDIPERFKHVGTALMSNGFVWHVYEIV